MAWRHDNVTKFINANWVITVLLCCIFVRLNMSQVKDLNEFLTVAELQHYYDNFKNDLKVSSLVSQAKTYLKLDHWKKCQDRSTEKI